MQGVDYPAFFFSAALGGEARGEGRGGKGRGGEGEREKKGLRTARKETEERLRGKYMVFRRRLN